MNSIEFIPGLDEQEFIYDLSTEKSISEPHLAVILLLDTSGSMNGEKIANLNEALNRFVREIQSDPNSRDRIDLAVVEFNRTVNIIQDFLPVSSIMPNFNLTADGTTHMGEGINKAIEMVKARNKLYNQVGTPIYRPWIFMITDGFPTDYDVFPEAAKRVREEEAKGNYGHLKFWALGVDGYDSNTLHQITDRVLKLNDIDFSTAFNWLSRSMVFISQSNVTNEAGALNLPANIDKDVSNW